MRLRQTSHEKALLRGSLAFNDASAIPRRFGLTTIDFGIQKAMDRERSSTMRHEIRITLVRHEEGRQVPTSARGRGGGVGMGQNRFDSSTELVKGKPVGQTVLPNVQPPPSGPGSGPGSVPVVPFSFYAAVGRKPSF